MSTFSQMVCIEFDRLHVAGNQPGKVKLCATAFMMGTLLVVEKFNCQAHSYFAAGQLVDEGG